MLHELVGMVLGHGHVLTAGMELPLHTREVYLAPLADPAPVLAFAARIYRHRLRVLQAVWVDDDGLLPWEQAVSNARGVGRPKPADGRKTLFPGRGRAFSGELLGSARVGREGPAMARQRPVPAFPARKLAAGPAA